MNPDEYRKLLEEVARKFSAPSLAFSTPIDVTLLSDLSKGYTMPYQKAYKGKPLAKLQFDFDYHPNGGFQLPNWPYFPNGATPYDYKNIKFNDYKDGFNKVVGSQWGRIIQKLDMMGQGVNQMVGNAMWGQNEIDWIEDVYGTTKFGRIKQLRSFFYDNAETEQRNSPLLIAGNIGQYRYGFVLLPMAHIKSMSPDTLRGMFNNTMAHGATFRFASVKIPFPFYASGVPAKDYQTFDTVDVNMSFEASTEYVIAYVMANDDLNKETYIQVVSSPNSTLMNGQDNFNGFVSPYTHLAKLMEKAYQNSLIRFGSVVSVDGDEFSLETRANRLMVISAFQGQDLPVQHFEHVDVGEISVPYGLKELPQLPGSGFTYLCDFQGIIYVTDATRTKVQMPYQVFDLIQMRANLEVALKEKPNSSLVDDLDEQVKLVEALFRHQANLLQGIGFAYSAFDYQGE